MSEVRSLVVSRKFDAAPERVFDAWVDPQMARKWLFTIPGGGIVVAENDPCVGGTFTFVDRRGDDEIRHVGEYLEIDRPRRLVFTFAVPQFSPAYDRVTIEIERQGEGCELTLTHEMAAQVFAEWGEPSRQGWTTMLGALDAQLHRRSDEGNGMIVDPNAVRIERVLPGPVERVWDYLTDSQKRRQWLAEGLMEPRRGGRVEHIFRNGELSHETTPDRFRHTDGPTVRVGEVIEFEPPQRLTYVWPGDEKDAPRSEVTFELFAQGEGTRLVVTHRKLADPEGMVSVASGWDSHLGVLIDILSNDTPRGFWSTVGALETVYRQKFGVPEEKA
ncbi:SRPBCC domain-containing protein [Aliihoeflea sp. PC F10.4]